MSDYSPIICGVPQGSILGALLFLVYINDLPACPLYSVPRMYANDTSLTLSSSDPIDLQSKLNSDLGYVHTGPVPNGSDPKIVPDRPFVHTGPANRTVDPFPIRSENWTSKKAGPVFGTVPVPNGSVTV